MSNMTAAREIRDVSTEQGTTQGAVRVHVRVTVNGRVRAMTVEPRTTLLDVMPEVTTCVACHRGAETACALNRDDMRARVSRVMVAVGAVALSLGLLAACATSPPTVAADRERDESACVRASIAFNDRGSTDLPFSIDRDAYRRCLAERGHHLPPSGIQAP